MCEAKIIDKAIKAALRPMKLKSAKERNAILAFAAEDMAEAYEIGAEEAQCEIVHRLQLIRSTLSPSPLANCTTPTGEATKEND